MRSVVTITVVLICIALVLLFAMRSCGTIHFWWEVVAVEDGKSPQREVVKPKKENPWIDVGKVSDYPLGTVSTKFQQKHGIYITYQVYNGNPQIYALRAMCTSSRHAQFQLGSMRIPIKRAPNWLENEQKFACPKCNSGFYGDGINFEGPAPRPLERYAIRVVNGRIQVDKSRSFREERGEWSNAASFVLIK